MKQLFTLIILSSFSLVQAQNQAGTLDKTFGTNGKVLTSSETAYLLCNAAAAQSDGSIITAGSVSFLDQIGGFFAKRYSADGLPDSSFGNKGVAVVPGTGYGQAVAVQRDNKIIIAGYDFDLFGPHYITIARLNANGSIDSSFDTNGTIKTLAGENSHAIAIQPDDKILIEGYNKGNVLTLRYLSDGTPDASFGNHGVVETSFGSGVSSGNAIAVQPDGKIVVAGRTDEAILLGRYNSDGSLDQTFGKGGKVLTDIAVGVDNISDIVLQPDGKIVAAGTTDIPGDLEDSVYTAVLRYLPDGSLDKSFGSNGSTVNKRPANAALKVVALQNDGKIVTAGSIYDATATVVHFLAERYTKDGGIDSSFGDNGYTITAMDYSDAAKGVIIQGDGKIVLAGSTYNGKSGPSEYAVALARYYGDGNTKQPLSIRIRRWLQHHGISWQLGNNIRYYAVQRSSDGMVYKEIAKLGNSSNTYEDATPLGKENYYRLAAIAKDGSRTYSNTILIDETQQVRMFPNPVKDNLQLQGLATGGKTAVSVVDLQGNVRTTATAGGGSYSVNTANLTPGNYLLKLQHNGTVTTQAFVKE